jgi:hypothetical protein
VSPNFCGNGRFFDRDGVALRYPRDLVLQQDGDRLSVEWTRSTRTGTNEIVSTYPVTPATILTDGSFLSSFSLGQWPNTTLSYTESWTLNASSATSLAGTGTGRFRAPGATTDAVVVNLVIQNLTRRCTPTC